MNKLKIWEVVQNIGGELLIDPFYTEAEAYAEAWKVVSDVFADSGRDESFAAFKAAHGDDIHLCWEALNYDSNDTLHIECLEITLDNCLPYTEGLSFPVNPYLGYGEETRTLAPRTIAVKPNGNASLEIVLPEPDREAAPSLMIEWSPERGWAIRTFGEREEPYQVVYIKDGTCALEGSP
jgi:hypothetical protein